MSAVYPIMRFAKYKGPEISRIEAHDERTKEAYASNPDVDTARSKDNFHLFRPDGKYRAMSEKRIAEVGCRTRSDSVRVVETLVTASPELERGESASETGRDHIPPRVFKQMAHLNKQRDALAGLIDGITPFNIKAQTEKICAMLDKYLPGVENMATLLKKYKKGLAAVTAENEQLAKENKALSDNSILKKMQEAKLLRDYESNLAVLNSIPPEVVEQYTTTPCINPTALENTR